MSKSMSLSPSPDPDKMQNSPEQSQSPEKHFDRELSPDGVDSFFINLFFNNYDNWRTNTRTFYEILSQTAKADKLNELIQRHGLNGYYTQEQIKAFLTYFNQNQQFKIKFLEKTMEYLRHNETYLDDDVTDNSFKLALSEYHDAIENNLILIPTGVDEAEYTKGLMLQKAAEYMGRLEAIPQGLPGAFRESTEEIIKSKYEVHKRQIAWAFFNPNLRRKYKLNKLFFLFDVSTIVRDLEGSINFEALKDNMFIFNFLIDDRYIPHFFIKIILDCYHKFPQDFGGTPDSVANFIISKISEGKISEGAIKIGSINISAAQLKYIIKKAYTYITNGNFKIDDSTILESLINNSEFMKYINENDYNSSDLLANAISIFFDDREKGNEKYTVEMKKISPPLLDKLGNINASNIKTFEIIAKTLDISQLLRDENKKKLREEFIENIAKTLHYEQLIRKKNAEIGEKVYVLQKVNKVADFKTILSSDEIDLVDKLIESFAVLRIKIDENNTLIDELAQLKKLIKSKNPAPDISDKEQIVNFLATNWMKFFDKEEKIKKSNNEIQEVFSTNILIPLYKIQEIAENERMTTRKKAASLVKEAATALVKGSIKKKPGLSSILPKISSKYKGAGRKPVKCTKTGVKKEILGKERCIYKKPNDRKEYVKYKGDLVTVKEFKEIHKKKTAKKSKDKKIKQNKTVEKSKDKKVIKTNDKKKKSKKSAKGGN